MRYPKSWRGLGSSLVPIALLLSLALPAHAGRPSRTKSAPAPETTTTPSTGDINPTSVPLVDDDFKGVDLVALSADPTLASDVGQSDLMDVALRDQINAGAANTVATGQGVVVAILDAGFTLDQPAFKGRVAPGGYDFVDDDDDPLDYGNGLDDDLDGIVDRGVGHGTMVAACVLNAAPDALILPLRVRDDEGKGNDYVTAKAIDYAIWQGVDVINLSLANDTTDDTRLRYVIEDAQARGIVVVASAGNLGLDLLPNTTVRAANLIVGAIDGANVRASFSNYTEETKFHGRMIFAPGVSLVGPLMGEGLYTRGYWSGTSFSAGVVSGAVALLKELHPDWDAYGTGLAVAESVRRVRLADGTPLVNSGRVDLAKVVER